MTEETDTHAEALKALSDLLREREEIVLILRDQQSKSTNPLRWARLDGKADGIRISRSWVDEALR